MPSTADWTIGRLLQWTSDYLRGHGSRSPRLDAEVLLAQSLGCERIELYTRFDETPGEPIRAQFRDLVKRRAAGTPVAYLVGHREFYSLPLSVTPAVLVPRPETEFVVMAALDVLQQLGTEAPLQVADVGTGSGAIAVAVARHAPQVRLWAVDRSPAALEVAAENVRRHGLEDRVQLVAGDLLEPLPDGLQLDLVLSNPPYVSQAEYERLPVEVRAHEPREALVAGVRGDEVIARLVPQAGERLRSGGWMLLEISPMIEPSVWEVIRRDGRWGELETVRDLARLARVVKARRL